MTELAGAEKWVATCIEQALPGVSVSLHDDGSRDSMYDLDLSRGGHRFGACEVTAAADSTTIEFWSVLNRTDGRWIDPLLQGGWALTVDPAAKVKDLKRDLPSVLRSLEGNPNDPAAQAKLKSLGIQDACQGGTSFPGSIYVMPWQDTSRTGGVVSENANGVVNWFNGWVSTDEQMHNVEKLRRSGAAEKHLAVVLPAFTPAPFEAVDPLMRDDVLAPDIAPRLPDGITHVWVMSTWTVGVGFRWDSTAWEPFGKRV